MRRGLGYSDADAGLSAAVAASLMGSAGLTVSASAEVDAIESAAVDDSVIG